MVHLIKSDDILRISRNNQLNPTSILDYMKIIHIHHYERKLNVEFTNRVFNYCLN